MTLISNFVVACQHIGELVCTHVPYLQTLEETSKLMSKRKHPHSDSTLPAMT